ncbi:MAG: hypothetical protein HY554_03470 [Elusimicrobia bacterium]|nr:hypothetical protein [Elusimicrobiota bacterium]
MDYPLYPPTGCADDILSILVHAESLRYARTGVVLPDKPASARAWQEPLGNAVGLALRALIALLPNVAVAALQQAVWRKLAAPNLFPFEPSHPRLAEAEALARELAAGGAPPALLILFTHPPVTGEWLNLNFELTRHALWAMGRLRPSVGRPNLIVAVDPFALDGFGLLLEGVYAAFMGGAHLGFDRLASHRGRLSRWLVGYTAWSRIAHRLARRLRAGGEVGIPLGGGVPTTSRALYSAKEYVWDLRRRRPGRASPAETLRALAAAEPDFAAFAESGLTGPALRRNAWRMLEAWCVATVSGAWRPDAAAEAEPSADRAALTPRARRAAEACARAMGYGQAEAAAAADRLDEELRRETPYRLRLFRVIAGRVARRRPLVIVPLNHGAPPDMGMVWGEPAALVGARGDAFELAYPGGRREALSFDAFARAFVRKNLP